LSGGSKFLSSCLVLSIFLYSFCSDLLTPREALASAEAAWATIRISEQHGCARPTQLRIPVGLMDFLANHSQSEPMFEVDGEILDAGEAWKKIRRLPPGHPLQLQVEEGSIEVELN
jgi:hypothetical protein